MGAVYAPFIIIGLACISDCLGSACHPGSHGLNHLEEEVSGGLAEEGGQGGVEMQDVELPGVSTAPPLPYIDAFSATMAAAMNGLGPVIDQPPEEPSARPGYSSWVVRGVATSPLDHVSYRSLYNQQMRAQQPGAQLYNLLILY